MSTSKKKKSGIAWEEWEQVDSSQYNGYSFHRWGVDHEGRHHEEWDDGSNVPRQGGNVDEITEQLGSQSLDPYSYSSSYPGSYTHHQPTGTKHSSDSKKKEKIIKQAAYKSSDNKHKSSKSKTSQQAKPKPQSDAFQPTQSQRQGNPAAVDQPLDEPDEPFISKGVEDRGDRRFQQSEYEQQHGEFELGGEGRAGSPHPTGHGSQVNEWPPHDEPQDVPGSDGGLGWPDEHKYRSYEERGDRKARHGPHKNTRHRENRDDSPNNAEYQLGDDERDDWESRRAKYGDSEYNPADPTPQGERAELDPEPDEEWRHAIAQNQYQTDERVPGPSGDDYEQPDQEPPTVSKNPTTGEMKITGPYNNREALDPRYRVEPSYRFQPGEVFKLFWAEPAGGGDKRDFEEEDSIRPFTDQTVKSTPFGRFHVGFRRFIVVATDEGCSTCVPIHTYGKKGLIKKGAKQAARHGIIHAKDKPAHKLSGEPRLGYNPIRVRVNDGEKLAKESRINYAKLTTIEHNVKVFFIGSVVTNDVTRVEQAVNDCWSKRKRAAN